ncbi:MAG: hypothetical protein ABIV47_26750 [Roseiflexaceae bacterium]
MIDLHVAPPESIPELVVAYGQPDPSIREQLEVRGSAEITSLLGDKNEVSIGQPQSFDLLSLLAADHKRPSAMIEAQADKADFVLVQFPCSFRPAADCEFIRASIRVHLELEQPNPHGKPIAYDMFPREVETPITVKRSFSASSDLKLSFAKLAELTVAAGKAEVTQEYISYEPAITPFALGAEAPGWDLNKTKARPIHGSRELFIVVKKPKGAQLFGRFELAATVQTNIIGRIPLSIFLLSGGTKPLIEERHPLTP